MSAARSVLLIEGDRTLREAISTRLRRAGCSVEAVADASAAAPLVVRPEFDVIVGTADVQEQLAGCTPLPFAVIRKPLDLEELVRAVRAASAASEKVDLPALYRFVASVPSLREALAAPTVHPEELVLRREIRRTMLEFSGALEEAAEGEPNRTRAAMFLAASAVAAELARNGH